MIVLCMRYYNNDVCNPGTSWTVVESPSPDVGAIHVAVGMNVVWAVTKDNKVRKFLNEHTGEILMQSSYHLNSS